MLREVKCFAKVTQQEHGREILGFWSNALLTHSSLTTPHGLSVQFSVMTTGQSALICPRHSLSFPGLECPYPCSIHHYIKPCNSSGNRIVSLSVSLTTHLPGSPSPATFCGFSNPQWCLLPSLGCLSINGLLAGPHSSLPGLPPSRGGLYWSAPSRDLLSSSTTGPQCPRVVPNVARSSWDAEPIWREAGTSKMEKPRCNASFYLSQSGNSEQNMSSF